MLRKIAEIKVPKGAGPREAKTNPIFATYDRQGAAFAFYFSDSNIAGATANLLFMIDGQKVFVDDGVTLSETNETHTFTYPLPDKLLNYTGKVDGYLYFDFEDGSHSDEIHFVFTIKKSQIDEEMEDAPDVYIKSFEEIKADVQSTADKATSDIKSRVDAVENAKNSTVGDIEKAKDDAESQIGDYVGEIESAKDDAESQIGDYVGEIESAKNDISSSASDVQSKASEANEDISNLIKSTEDARDEAVKTMNELDYSDRNLLRGTSDEWEKYEWSNSYGHIFVPYSIKQIGLKAGDAITISKQLDNTIDNNDMSIFFSAQFRDSNGKIISSIESNRINPGDVGKVAVTGKIPEGTETIYICSVQKGNNNKLKKAAGRCDKLQKGIVATGWNPAPEDIALKSDIEQLKQAIINLGGSV